MLVSYIVPLYNKRDFIIEALNSMVDESSEEICIEVCVVDDGSTDGSPELVRNYIELRKLENVHLHVFPENRGKVAATNMAYSMASGDFIALVGADDIVVQGRTKRMIAEALQTGRSVYGECVSRTSAEGSDIRRYRIPEPSFEKILIQNHYSGGCSLFWRKDAEKIFPVPAALKFEDWWLAYWLVKHERMAVIHDVVLIYRIHGENDCGVVEETVESVRRDMVRHYAYFDAFESNASSQRERIFLRKGRLLRDAVFGKARLLDVFEGPFDKTSVQVAIVVMFGLGAYLKMMKWRMYLASRFSARD